MTALTMTDVIIMTDDCTSGASFLIPYVIMLVVVGLPAMLIELSAGQYARVGANKVFGRMVPAFKVMRTLIILSTHISMCLPQGLGYGMLLVRFYVNVYYVIVCAWAFFYLFSGFTSTLPWSDCGDSELNTIGCYSPREIERCNVSDDDDDNDDNDDDNEMMMMM